MKKITQIYVNGAGFPKIDAAPEVFQLALLDGEGRTEKVLAAIKDGPIARAALEATKTQHPEHKLKLLELRQAAL